VLDGTIFWKSLNVWTTGKMEKRTLMNLLKIESKLV